MKSAGVMPHYAAREAHKSPETTATVEQVVRGRRARAASAADVVPLVEVLLVELGCKIVAEKLIDCHVADPL